MKLIAFPLVGVATLAGVVVFTAPAANQEGAPIFVTSIPAGYRDWRLISVAHEEGNFHSFSAVLGNDLAIQAYRDGKIPFPDGAIIAALHYRHVPSEENNKVFGQEQSFVAGVKTKSFGTHGRETGRPGYRPRRRSGRPSIALRTFSRWAP